MYVVLTGMIFGDAAAGAAGSGWLFFRRIGPSFSGTCASSAFCATRCQKSVVAQWFFNRDDDLDMGQNPVPLVNI